MGYQSKYTGAEIDAAIESVASKATTAYVDGKVADLLAEIEAVKALLNPIDPTDGVPEEEIQEPNGVDDLTKEDTEETPTPEVTEEGELTE